MITKEMIPQIEQALGIHLLEHQKEFILGTDHFLFYGGRSTGRTLACIIKLVLTDGEPLDLQGCSEQFMSIHTKLKENGLNVRRLA